MRKLLFVLFFTVALCCSQTKTFIREYTYTAGEADSKITSRAIALDQVKRILLEEIGVYLQSEINTTKEEKNEAYNELTKQQIQSITAGITETKIIEEKWNGETYYIKASISVDPDEVNKSIARIGADQSKLKELEDVKRKADDAFAEIERLRKELASSKSEIERSGKQKKYNDASNTLSATYWFQKGYNAHELRELDNAILYYQKAIELNPQFGKAYVNLGVAYTDNGNLDKSIISFEKAIKFNPQDFAAYNNLGIACSKNGDRVKAIKFFKKAIELNPQCSKYYNNLGAAYKDLGNLDKAILYFQKATKLNPQDDLAYYNLGVAYAENDNRYDALLNIRKSAQLGNQDAQQWLKQNGQTW